MSTPETDHPTESCRICGSRDLAPVLDLGRQPLANALLPLDSVPGAEATYPLALCRCAGCGLVQLTHDVPASVLFPADYPFATGQSRAMAAHFAALAEECVARFVPVDGLLLEVGSNDGTLLASVADRCVRTLGVDPAAGQALAALGRGVETYVAFFGAETAREVRSLRGPASCVVACNVVAHCADLHDLVAGVAEALAADGTFVLEFPWAADMVSGGSFDAVYHEHRSYLAAAPMRKLLAGHGLAIVDARRVPTHGGSLRVYARRAAGACPETDGAGWLAAIEARELSTAALARFADGARATRDRLRATIDAAWRAGKRVAGYGAPAKATVLLNYCGLTHREVPFTVDSTPAKRGRLIPGARVPVLDPDAFRSARPDLGVLFAWNHADEIRSKEAAWLAGGGRFVLPLETAP